MPAPEAGLGPILPRYGVMSGFPDPMGWDAGTAAKN